ncbi:MAG: BMP family ABC transporter substrate-binding protein [Chloroflexi bacterium]|nr:BMP family ABC transporter substrate-binding protein [Chloroflexota bacterium]
MKRIWTLISAVALLSLIVSACGGGAAPAPTEAPAAPKLKIAMLTSGSVTDEGWNQTAYDGLLALKAEGYEVANTENVAQADQASIIENYVNQGFTVIVGHGFEYGDALTASATAHPDVHFIQIGGIATGDNLASYVFKSGEGGYVAGVLASYLSKSGKWGFVGAVEIPTIKADQLAYEMALQQANPDASVVAAYTGSWVDIPKAKEAALAQISAGVDVILANGDNANVGAIQAAKEKGDVIVIGWTRDQSHLAPDNVALSIVQRVDVILMNAVADIEAGKFKGGNYELGFKEGIEDISKFGPMVPEEAQAAVKQAVEDLKANKIALPPVQ